MNVVYWLLPILGIGFVIFFHELGHFLAARAMGVRVEAFSIGFGPRLFGFKRGATDWKICLIPLGGFVKMAGETPNAPKTGAADEFSSKGVAARTLIISAGVIMNVVFALIALPVAFMIGVPFETPRLGSVDVEGPAWRAGIRAGDRITAVDGRRTLGYEDVVTAVAIGGDVVTIEADRNGTKIVRDVTTKRDERRGLPTIGVGPSYAPVEIKGEDVDAEAASEAERAVAAHRKAAGLKVGDSIVAVDGVPVSELTGPELQDPKSRTLRVRRGAETIKLTLPPYSSPEVEDTTELFGLSAVTLTVVEVVADSPAAAAGLRKGDRIVRAGDRDVYTVAELSAALEALGETAGVSIERAGAVQTLVAKTPPDLAASLRRDVAYGLTGRFVVPIEGGAAGLAGIRRGDEVVTLDGAAVETFPEIQKIDPARRTVTFGVKRAGAEGTVEVKVTRAKVPVNQALLGLEHSPVREIVQTGFRDSLTAGFDYTVMMTARIFMTLKSLFTRRVSAENLGGIITIFRQSAESSKISFSRGLLFLAVISINLAVLNVLPIPVLDGGWLLLLLIEKLRGRPVSERVLGTVSWAGFVLVLGLMVFVTWNDIKRLWL
jgi:regulator of sigma E protease